MAPTTAASNVGHIHYSKEHLTSSHKLRKPMVEKLRRDRINTSIEQLKSLLGPEFLRQQPDSKQEKADILEMAVAYLKIWRLHKRQQHQRGADAEAEAGGDGYASCVQEAVAFLSKSQANGLLLNHFLRLQGASGATPQVVSPPGSPLAHQTGPAAVKAGGRSPLWRPW
ncbi:hypothetical protein NHX12_012233 [Muraenolepis orangiensis]|uniref:Transcription factor HES-5 n=1 Tax=Muraenolepis orangiensis TaxID=630683 RepID=A0A9Q0DC45_9TELE|nr:hypothetical protein NHX12_012233 [Muraenolepis orangiensis]